MVEPISLPTAEGIDFGGGDVEFFTQIDPVSAGIDNRPLKNMTERDNILAAKVNEIIADLDTKDFYRPHEQSVIDNTVLVEAGRHIKTTGTGAIIISTTANGPVHTTVTTGQERYDLLSIDDSGTLILTTGSEVPITTGNPLLNAPTFPDNSVVLAIVKIDEDVTVLVVDADITDVREFLNKTQDPASGTRNYEKVVATADKTVFNLGFTYSAGSNILKVTRQGERLVVGTHYSETSGNPGIVTLLEGAKAGDELIFETDVTIRTDDVGTLAYHRFPFLAIGATIFQSPFPFAPGTNALKIIRNGARLVDGVHYVENSSTQFTLFDPIASPDETLTIELTSYARLDIISHDLSAHTNAASIFDTSRGSIKVNCDDPNKVIIEDGTNVLSIGGESAIKFTVDKELNIQNGGLNGLDTGSEAPNTWYALWALRNPSNGIVGSVFSLNFVVPSAPAGFTQMVRIGAVFNKADSDLRRFNQIIDIVQYKDRVAALSTSVDPGNLSWQTLNLSASVPPTSRDANLSFSLLALLSDINVSYINNPSIPVSGTGVPAVLASGNTAAQTASRNTAFVRLDDAQTLYWYKEELAGSPDFTQFDVDVIGYKDVL